MPIKAQGLNVVIEIDENNNGTWKIAVCETSSGFNGTRETTSVNTKCEGGSAATGLGSLNWTFEGSGAAALDPDAATQFSYQELLGMWKAGKRVAVRRVESTTGKIAMKGFGYITSISDSAPTDNVVEFNYTITGDSTLDITPVVIEP